MTTEITKNGSVLNIAVEGRIDTVTSPDLEKTILDNISEVEDMTIDLKGVDYISSAGLRVLLSTQKIMDKQGKLLICGVGENVMEIFEVTGFVDIFDIE
ncbi:MAG: STAS domain-containing protein [Clostridiales bacterium]|nr:STAS domain-containing protein [Clostridiales bacterium]